MLLSPPIPCQWQELFKLLKSESPLRSAERWICDHVTHRYGNRVAHQWKTLLDYLSDVVIISERCTDIRQVCVHDTLSPWLQRNLLAIIYQHRKDIKDEDLKQFVVKVGNKEMKQMSWAGLLWELLSRHLGIQQAKLPKGGSSVAKLTSKGNSDVTSSASDESSKVVCVGEMVQDPGEVPMWLDELKDDAVGESTSDGDGKGNAKTDFILILDEDEKREEIQFSPPAKKIKLEDEKEDEVKNDDIQNEELLDAGRQVLDALHSSPEDKDLIGETVDKLLFLPSEQLQKVCRTCGLSNMAESHLAALCGVLVKQADRVTSSSCVALIAGLMGNKLESLQQTASRQLQGVTVSLATTFPLQLLDAVIVPSFIQQLGAAQSELLTHLVKDCLNKHHLTHLLRRLVTGDVVLTESALSVVYAVVEAKPLLDDQLLTDVLASLLRCADEFKSNLKFGKLLLSFINKYGAQWSRTQVSTMDQILGRHKTFLRTKILTVMKNL